MGTHYIRLIAYATNLDRTYQTRYPVFDVTSQSLNFRYKILAVTDNNGNDVMEQNEFKINPKYRNRPMAYLRAEKTILYNEVSRK